MSIFSSRPLVLLLLMLCAALVLDRAAVRLGEAALRHSGFRYARLYFGTAGTDVAIFGNSRAVHAFHAPTLSQALCRPVENLAYNGLDMAGVAALAQDTVARDPGLKVAVIEVTALFSAGRTTAQLAPFARQSPRLSALIQADAPGILPWRHVLGSLALNSEMFWRALLYLGESDQGWINHKGPPPVAVLDAYRARPPRQMIADPAALAQLRGLIAALEAAGVQPVLTVAPYHPVIRTRAEPSDWLAQLSENLHFPILDLGVGIQQDALFADPLHGNLDGAIAVARALVPELGRCGTGS
ncbi:MAG: hypothetical protein JXJ18_06055 [Rhodobacteraceae bacterium]|nr:hypothetical protein [Paracoccaceae bacterium]